MTGVLLVISLIFVLLVSLALVPWIGWLVIFPLLAMIWFAIMVVRAFAHGRTPGSLLRSTPKAELLGPGGPDDPDR